MTVLHRRPGAASVAALGVITLTVAAAHAIAPAWSERVGLDLWRYSEYVEDHRQCIERRKELAANHDRLLHQIDAGDRIAAQLIERHTSLADAAEEVGRVNEDRTGFLDSLRFSYRDAATAQRRFARYLIARVQIRLQESGDSSRLAEVTSRLEAEYQELPTTP